MAEETGQVRTEKLDAEAEARRRIALAQIRQYPDPALRMRAKEIEGFDNGLAQLIERLEHLLHDANGLGLAATQIGVLQRVFVFQPNPEAEPRALVKRGAARNPTAGGQVPGEKHVASANCSLPRKHRKGLPG